MQSGIRALGGAWEEMHVSLTLQQQLHTALKTPTKSNSPATFGKWLSFAEMWSGLQGYVAAMPIAVSAIAPSVWRGSACSRVHSRYSKQFDTCAPGKTDQRDWVAARWFV